MNQVAIWHFQYNDLELVFKAQKSTHWMDWIEMSWFKSVVIEPLSRKQLVRVRARDLLNIKSAEVFKR